MAATDSEIRTHAAIDSVLCGEARVVAEGRATVELSTRSEMAVDERGLVHGGFVFGLADHAAMLAVNEPTVVLAAAEVRFLRPVEVGEVLEAEAVVVEREGARSRVDTLVTSGAAEVLRGVFHCVTLGRHVLDR